jgi:hypothetical protein
LRRSERLREKAQQGAYIEEIPEMYFGEVLEHNFCSVAFKIDEDKLLVHSNEFSVQNSDEEINYVENIVQSTTLKPDEEKREEMKGEEQTLNKPFTYKEAMKAPDTDGWIKVMEFELDTLMKMHVWEVTQPPANTNIVGSKWVYRYKYNPQGLIIKRRACLVAQGFTQVFGVDYEDTFSPVIHLSSLRLICALAARNNWSIHQMDIDSAYLNTYLDEPIYLKQLLSYSEGNNVLLLKKALYGLKQSG